MEWNSFALLVAATLNLVIGGVVLVRNSQKRLNKYFFGLTFAVTGWTVTNILFAMLAGDARFAIALLSYGFAGFCGVFFCLFCVEYLFAETGRLYFNRRILRTAVVLSGALSVISVAPKIVGKSVTPEGEIVTNLPMLILYGLSLLAMIILGLRALFIARKSSNQNARQRTNIILYGLALTAIIGIFFNLVLPIQGIYSFVDVGPLGSLVLVASCAYAIAKHKLFDIRLVIARAMGYVLSIIFVGIGYSLMAFFIADTLIPSGDDLTSQQRLIFTLSAVVIAFSFPPLKKLFDKLTNAVFYRDAYDPQIFIDKLNRTLVEYTDLSGLLGESATLISDTFKSDFCVFAVPNPGDRSSYSVVGSNNRAALSFDKMVIDPATFKESRTNIIATDDLESRHDKFKLALEAQNVAFLVQIFTERKEQNRQGGSAGYLVVGSKKSGNAYTAQDRKMFEIIANSMVIALQNAYRFDEIRRFNKTLQEKIDEATTELQQTNHRLRVLDQTKDDFISMASHQLRTPLTSVKGYVSMVLDGDAGKVNELQKKLLTQSFLSSQRMVYLISDLLNVSRLRTGKFVIEPNESNLAEVIESEVEQLQETAKGRELTLAFKRPEHFPTLMIDENKLRQVIMNFIDNAIYYTPAKGHITINLVDRPDSIEFTVVDDGIGVPKMEQHHLFSKFYRAHNAKRARPDGTGLGLFMAKKVIIAQGGAVIFKSQEGKGSTFGFTFPKKKLLKPELSSNEVPPKTKVPTA